MANEPIRVSASARANAEATVPLRALLLMYAAERGIGKARLQNLRTPLRWWRTHLLREATTADLTPDAITALYKFCFRHGIARGTVEKFREKIRCMVRYAAEKELIGEPFEVPAAIGRPAKACRMRDKAISLPAGTLAHYYRHVWLADAQPKRHLQEEYDSHLNHWLRFHDGPDPLMADVTEAMLGKFRQYLLDVGCAERTAYRAVARLKSLLRHAEPERWPKNHAWNRTVETTAPEGSLREFFERTYLGEHELKPQTAKFYGYTIARFREYLRREPMLVDLTDRTFNDFISAAAEIYSPHALRGYYRALLAMWRSAFAWEATEVHPRRTRRPKVPPMIPDAWTLEETAALIEAAGRLPGKAGGIPRRLLLRAWMLAQYDTAFRTADMLALRLDNVDWITGVVVIRQEKTGFPISRRLRPETLAAISATLAFAPGRERLFPLSKDRSRRGLYRAWSDLRELADMCGGREERNGPQKVRRTSATHLAREAGIEAATKALGHKDASLAVRYYLDPSQAFAPPPLPPALPLRQSPVALLPEPGQEGGADDL